MMTMMKKRKMKRYISKIDEALVVSAIINGSMLICDIRSLDDVATTHIPHSSHTQTHTHTHKHLDTYTNTHAPTHTHTHTHSN